MNKRSNTLLYFFIFDAIIFFFQTVGKSIYTPLLVPFMGDFGINATQGGTLITLVMLGYAIARFPSGILTDIIGCKRTIIISGFIMGGTLFAVAIAPNYYMMALLSFVMGISTGLYVTAGYTFSIVVSFKNKETIFTALLEMFGGVGTLLAPLFVVLFLEKWNLGWRSMFYIIGSGLLLTNFLFLHYSKGKDVEGKDNKKFKFRDFLKEIKKILSVFKNTEITKFIIWATLVGGFGFFSITGFNTFIPSLLMEKGYSFSQANQLFSLIAVSGLISKIGVAWLADNLGTKRVLFGILVLNISVFILFTSDISHFLVLFSLIILGITFSSHNTLINSYVLKLFPEDYRGTGFGLFSTLYTVIYSLGPLVTGIFSDRFGLVVGMRFSIIGILISMPLLMLFNQIIDLDKVN